MEIFDKINSSATIITPNRRLAATLLEKHHEYLANKHSCWHTLDILPFQSWIQRLWDQVSITHMNTHDMVLSNSQEHLLWESILRASPKNDSLLQLSATAELAKSAYATLKQWQVDLSQQPLYVTEDSQAFYAWSNKFKTLCAQNNWIDFNTVTQHILDYIKNGLISLPHEIWVVGFTELSPLQKSLFENCKSLNINIHMLENIHSFPKVSDETCYYTSLPDYETEIYTIAKWAKYHVEQNYGNKALKIGCIFPSLENSRDRVVQIFSDVFANQDFNISAGKSLTSYPIIHAAIKIIQTCQTSIPYEKMNYLLLTPFIGDAETELTRRATFDSHLRDHNITMIQLSKLDYLEIEKYCPRFKKRLCAVLEKLTSHPEYLLPSAWVERIMEILSIIGWPGERIINSEEYQIVQRFLAILREYQTFDHITKKIAYDDAIHHIEDLATHTIFQPQSKNAPVQILGLLEAANLPFDYTWVAGLDDTVWPPPAKPNPFIPHKLQKTLHMPHATAEKELLYSTKLTEQLTQSAGTIIFSHALALGDAALRPSALISHYKKLALHDIPQADFISAFEISYQSQSIEAIHDENAPAVSTDEYLQGGVNILKRQAACAFKAFSETRLHAYPLETPHLGLRAEDRGVIIHKALELLWAELKDHATLMHISDHALEEIIDICAKKAMSLKINHLLSQQKYLALETTRLKNLLHRWLTLEKNRPPFKVISNEENRTMTIGNIPINVRVDRIDLLENGDHLVIDYKTGKYNAIKYWFSEQPEEPQLPLYCLSDTENIKAMAYAELHPEKINLLGISKEILGIDKIKPIHDINTIENRQWDELIQSWKTTFEKLANEFMLGHAAVAPKNDIETCQYCELKPFCRIHESQAE